MANAARAELLFDHCHLQSNSKYMHVLQVYVYGMFVETLFECTLNKKLSDIHTVVTDCLHTPLIVECKF